jgi:NitT/TauT family transport system substrate-binding protein
MRPLPAIVSSSRLARLALACLAVIALAAVAASPRAAGAEPFRLIITELSTPLLPNSVMELAKTKGYFEREGVDVEIVRVQETPMAMAALLAGQGDMANVATDSVLRLAARDQLGAKAVISPNKSFPYVVVARSGIVSVAALNGVTYGVGRVGSLDYSLTREVLRAKGIDVDKLTMLAAGTPEIRLKALAAGRIDATTVSTASWLTFADKSIARVIVEEDEFFRIAPVVAKVNVVPDKVLARRRGDVVRVVTALIKASRDFARTPQDWAAAMAAARPDVSREALVELAGSFKTAWSVNGGLSRSELDFTAGWMFKSPEFRDLKPVGLRDWVDFSVVDEVRGKLGDDPSADKPDRGP